MSIGIWSPQGTVISTSPNAPQGSNVLYEDGAKILSGTVFKMWVGSGNSGIYYYESSDGLSWTPYGSNPVISSADAVYCILFKNSGTYYLYARLNAASISAWTSTDGVTWTEQNSSAIALGIGGAWDSSAIFPAGVIDIIDGTWYMAYAGSPDAEGATSYPMGIVTSTDGINWTKYAGNPVINDGTISAAMTFAKVNGQYYGWTQYVIPGGWNANNQGFPGDIGRYQSSSIFGPWTTPTYPSMYRTNANEGAGVGFGSIQNPCLVEANGNTYLYVTAKSDGLLDTGGVIECFIAEGMTIAQVVQTQEGVLNVPIPWTKNTPLNLATLARDNFQRANANPIGGNWTQVSSAGLFAANQLSNNMMLPATTATTRGGSFWNPLTWPSDQWSSIVIAAISSGGSQMGPMVRSSTSGAATAYMMALASGAPTASGTISALKWVAGTETQIASLSYNSESATNIVKIGSVVTTAIVGSTMSVFVDGNLIGAVTDNSIASGAAGAIEFAQSAVTNAEISAWSGGSIANAPLLSAWYPLDCRDYESFPLTPVIVQGSGIYALDPNSDNSKLPPTDSRKMKPTDCRIVEIIPENSRVNPNPNA